MSDRAELWGVMLACIVVPEKTNLQVFLDGQSVVNSSESMLANSQTPRKKLRAQCCVDWFLLRTILKEKTIRVTLRWVKGHSDNVGNNISDLVPNETCKAYQLGLTLPLPKTTDYSLLLTLGP
jgi:ribonuclease HI